MLWYHLGVEAGENVKRALFAQVSEMVLAGEPQMLRRFISHEGRVIPRVEDFVEVQVRTPFVELCFKILEKEGLRFADRITLGALFLEMLDERLSMEQFAVKRLAGWEDIDMSARQRLVGELGYFVSTTTQKQNKEHESLEEFKEEDDNLQLENTNFEFCFDEHQNTEEKNQEEIQEIDEQETEAVKETEERENLYVQRESAESKDIQ